MEWGTARIDSRVATMMIGRIRSERETRRQNAAAGPEAVDEQPERQEAVDDGRDRGEVGDVDLDDVRQPVLACVFLQVDPGAHPHRDGDRGRDQDHEERADPGGEDAGGWRVGSGL